MQDALKSLIYDARQGLINFYLVVLDIYNQSYVNLFVPPVPFAWIGGNCLRTLSHSLAWQERMFGRFTLELSPAALVRRLNRRCSRS
jgi:hypothetical protein